MLKESNEDAHAVEIWKLGRVITQWDMISNYGYIFYKMANALSLLHRYSVQSVLAGQSTERFEAILPNFRKMLETIKGYCQAFGFPASLDKCRFIIGWMDEFAQPIITEKRIAEIVRMADDLNRTLQSECESEQFYHLSRTKNEYYHGNQFPMNVRDRFSSAIYDMDEAGKCFALDRFSACAFHLMRVIECGLIELKDILGVERDNPSWHSILKALSKNIDALSDSREQEKYRKIVSRVYAIKDAWRNPTMHVEYKYNEEEAREVFDATRNFMKVLCEELTENKD
jgi:hypothetical protein